VFTYFTEQDISIISKVKHKQGYTMIDSIFGLGVVTGDNQKLLFNSPIDESEQIYTGKEVTKYKLLNPNKHIVFNRDVLQQVAPNEIYRAPQKLVYKTINKHIKIAMDNTGSLTTNSANIFIPNIDGLDIHTVMGLLNSELYSYLNLKLFGGVNKVSKENLQSLPLPKVSNEENEHIKNLVLLIIENGDDNELQKYINKNIFGLTEEEIKYINNYNLNN
jgi:hypothetical protein